MSISSFAIQGNFTVKNAMASSTLSDLMRVRKETIRNCLESFENEPHRLEEVLKIHGAQYINDAKAGNVNAAYYALENMSAPTVWIVEGSSDVQDYEMLLPVVNEKVKAIICLGDENAGLATTFGGVVEFMIETSTVEDAVKIAYKLVHEKEVVLFSPIGSENDTMSYDALGNRFKEAVRNL